MTTFKGKSKLKAKVVPELAKKAPVVQKNYNGKGTRARLNTAAEKNMFGRKASY